MAPVVALLAVLSFGGFGARLAAAQADEAAVQAKYEKLLAAYSGILFSKKMNEPDAITFSIKNNMLSKGLKALLLKDAACAKKGGGICNLDFDFLLNGQDACKPLKVVGLAKNGDAFALKVSNGGEACDKAGYYKPYDFKLIDEAGAWVIDDATYTTKDEKGKIVTFTLRGVLTGKP